MILYAATAGAVLGLMSLWMYWLNPPAFKFTEEDIERNGPLEDDGQDHTQPR